MTKATEELGFNTRQVKQIAEIVEQVVERVVPPIIERTVPPIVEQIIERTVPPIVERIVEPHFAAVQSVLLDRGEILDKHTQQLHALQEDVSDIKDDIISIKKRQKEEQHSIDRHDRELATLKR